MLLMMTMPLSSDFSFITVHRTAVGDCWFDENFSFLPSDKQEQTARTGASTVKSNQTARTGASTVESNQVDSTVDATVGIYPVDPKPLYVN